MRPQLLITCEHGGHRIPARYAHLFEGHDDVLQSHRGHDPGALELAKRFTKHFGATLFYSTVSRLLIELNRSLGHPHLFSEFSRKLAPVDKQRLIDDYYSPHRSRITHWLQRRVRSARVVHLSVHSFTPVWRGQARRADVGLLYDPARQAEVHFCGRWRDCLQSERDDLVIRRNYPYLGKADGLTTALRKTFGNDRYLGLELEVNQRWVNDDRQTWLKLQTNLARALRHTMDSAI